MLTYYARDVSVARMRNVSAEWIGGADARLFAVAVGRERSEIEVLLADVREARERSEGRKGVDEPKMRTKKTEEWSGSLNGKEVSVAVDEVADTKSLESDSDDVEENATDVDDMKLVSELDWAEGEENDAPHRSAAEQMLLKIAENFSEKRKKRRTNERRLIHDAAWSWIEAHLDHYAKIFRDGMVNPNVGKATLWDDLVALRVQKEELLEELKGLQSEKSKRV